MNGQIVLGIMQGVGVVVMAIIAVLMYPQLRRKETAGTADLVEKVASSQEDRDVAREQREIERFERLDKRLERAELSVEIMSAYIVYDEDWHFHESRTAASEGRPMRDRMTFDQYGRRYRKDWFVDRLDQVITKREEEGGRHGD